MFSWIYQILDNPNYGTIVFDLQPCLIYSISSITGWIQYLWIGIYWLLSDLDFSMTIFDNKIFSIYVSLDFYSKEYLPYADGKLHGDTPSARMNEPFWMNANDVAIVW